MFRISIALFFFFFFFESHDFNDPVLVPQVKTFLTGGLGKTLLEIASRPDVIVAGTFLNYNFFLRVGIVNPH